MTSSYVNTTNPLLPNIEAIKMTNEEYKNLLHILGDKDIEEIFSKHNNIFSTTKALQELIGRKQNLLSEVERQQSFQIVMSKYKDRFTTVKVGALHDFKNLTIKFDYDPIIDNSTFGLGINF